MYILSWKRWAHQQTNVNLNNKFVVLDVSDAQKDFLPVAMFLALDYVWDKCKENRNVNKCVFIDETWRLVCSDAPIEAANFVVEIFRTMEFCAKNGRYRTMKQWSRMSNT